MIELDSFPNDDKLWLVKWVDKFGFLGVTRAAVVDVLLQRLPFDNPDILDELTLEERSKLLGVDQEGPWLTKKAKVAVGTIPHIAIGTVFRNRSFVGELSLHRKEIHLPDPAINPMRIGDEVAPPSTWKSSAKYLWLNRYEYSGLIPDFSDSQFLLHQTSEVDHLIPLSVILRYFYAPHTRIANAIISNPWNLNKSELVYFGEMESGYKTCAENDPVKWNIIIKNLSKNFAFLMALYSFDFYAESCANLIFSEAQKYSVRSKGNISLFEWYCRARIPFKKGIHPLTLDVKGFPIGPTKSIPKMKFLVTSIVGCSVPEYIPPISAALFNSNEKGEIIVDTDEEPPYIRTKKAPQPNRNLAIDEGRDSIEAIRPIAVYSEEYEWLNPPPVEWQKKKQSKAYPKPPPRIPADVGGNAKVSTGLPGSPSTSLSPVNLQNPSRLAPHRFKLIVDAMNKITQEKPLTFEIIQPADSNLATYRNGYICWKFLSEQVREQIKMSDDGWRIIRSRSDGDTDSQATSRAALVLKITYKSHVGYWIEIENNPNEPGARSPFVFNMAGDLKSSLLIVLDAIAELNGVSLFKKLQGMVSSFVDVRIESYRHQYEKGSAQKIISTSSILTHLDKCFPEIH